MLPLYGPLKFNVIDIVVPCPETRFGNEHLVFSDKYKKRNMAFPSGNFDGLKCGLSSLTILSSCMVHLGIYWLKMDQAHLYVFCSRLYALCSRMWILRVTHLMTIKSHLQINDEVEPCNNTIANWLHQILTEHQTDLDQVLLSVTYSFNAPVHVLTGTNHLVSFFLIVQDLIGILPSRIWHRQHRPMSEHRWNPAHIEVLFAKPHCAPNTYRPNTVSPSIPIKAQLWQFGSCDFNAPSTQLQLGQFLAWLAYASRSSCAVTALKHSIENYQTVWMVLITLDISSWPETSSNRTSIDLVIRAQKSLTGQINGQYQHLRESARTSPHQIITKYWNQRSWLHYWKNY